MYVYILTNDKQQRARSRLQPNRPANRCRCLLVSAKGETGWRCCRKHTSVPQSSASLPENLHIESYGAVETEREASGFGPIALRPLYAPFSLSPRLPPFIDQEGSRFPHNLTILPNKSNYLGSLSYLVPSIYKRSAHA